VDGFIGLMAYVILKKSPAKQKKARSCDRAY